MSASTKTTITSGDADGAERQISYEAYLRRFEVEAAAFERGFRTSLLIEQFKEVCCQTPVVKASACSSRSSHFDENSKARSLVHDSDLLSLHL